MAVLLKQLAACPRPVAEIGGKARHLAELAAAGLPVPDAVVMGAGEPLDDQALAAIAALGEPLAVRSSSPLEDRADHAAPGLFLSRVDIGLAEVAAAFAEVRAAAGGDLVRAYLEATGRTASAAMGVIVQRYIEPVIAGTAYSRAPGRPELLLIESRGGPIVELERGRTPPPRWAALVDAVLAAERAIGADDGADVEWVEGRDGLWLVQARPLRPSPRLRRPPDAIFSFAAADPGRRWRLDLRHNPEPLSPAQQGLVELVVERNDAPLALAAGYLYEAIDQAIDQAPDAAGPAPEAPEAIDLEALFFAEVEPALDRQLAALEQRPADLEAALDTFADLHRDYARVAAALSATRATCARTPARLGTPRAHAVAMATDPRARDSTRARAAALAALTPRELYAAYATAWDVAAPLLDGADHNQVAVTPTRDATEMCWLADLCAAIGELDDRLFYRAQRQVRRALLERGERLGIGDDIFWLPLAEVRSSAPLAAATGRAERARRERDDASALSMPVELHGPRRVEPEAVVDRLTLRGRGFGGRAAGQVARLGSATAPSTAAIDSAVVIAVDMTPADVIRARRAAAIALEAGSLLGHAAAMARELDIPIIVRIPGLCRLVRDRERVAVDGERGLLLREVGGRG